MDNTSSSITSAEKHSKSQNAKTISSLPNSRKLARYDSKLDSNELDQALHQNNFHNIEESKSKTKEPASSSISDMEDQNIDKVKRRPKSAHLQIGFWIWFLAILFLLASLYCLYPLIMIILVSFLQPKSSRHKPIVRTRNSLSTFSLPARLHELESILVRPALNIHMLWTTIPETFKERNYKVLDSYLYHHSDAVINIYASHLDDSFFKSYRDAGYAVKVIKLDDGFLHDMSNHCPGKTWINNLKKWKQVYQLHLMWQGKYYYSHITDFVRFCALYRWGGLYTDFDAITTQRLDQHENFIGRDSAMSNGTCNWCAWKRDIYLPPGVMATSKGHALAKTALEIGFDGEYNPDIFNSVGPIAVTKAYNALSKSQGFEVLKIFEQHELYPYHYQNSHTLFAAISDARGKLERLRKDALSLHLYGHQTSKLDVHPDSILAQAFQLFSVIENANDYRLIGPSHLAIGQVFEQVADIRIISPKSNHVTTGQIFKASVKVENGLFRFAELGRPRGSIQEWTNAFEFTAQSSAEMNRILSRIIYNGQHLSNGRDIISIIVSYQTGAGAMAQREIQIPVYDISALVTIIVKTVGRMDKVIALVESARKYYKTVKIIVSDDHEELFRKEPGMSREFYYLPLPNDIGLSAGRNRMIERVETEYFLTLDDDFTIVATSQIGVLLHALESAPVDGSKRFDIAGAKNPVDEAKFGLDFCGFLTITNKTLYLHEGSYGSHKDCNHVDFVPNIFLGRRQAFDTIKWDEMLKLGEHEDFFIRAKALGIKTLTCPGVTFTHDQVPHWLKRDAYEVKRSRVYDFWRLSLRKHGLERINSFGRIMMDLIDPPPVDKIYITQVLAQSLNMCWESKAPAFRILYAEIGSSTWKPVNKGQGADYYGGNSITVHSLEAGREYQFMVYAGNKFSFESKGLGIQAKTMALSELQGLCFQTKTSGFNIISNPSFESGHHAFDYSIGGIFHTQRKSKLSGKFGGRTQILTRSYQSLTPTLVYLSQSLNLDVQCGARCNFIGQPKNLLLSMNSKAERLFGWTSWRTELHIWFSGSIGSKADVVYTEDFDMSDVGWQVRILEACLSPDAIVGRVQVRGVLEAFRGSVFWDDFALIMLPIF